MSGREMVVRLGETQMVVALEQLGPGGDVRPVFVAERTGLLELLGDLSDEQWAAPTICAGWTVRDVALHLLHDDLRRLSRTRDKYDGGLSPVPGQTLPELLNDENQRWVSESSFLSPSLLVDLLSHTAQLLELMWAGAELEAPSEGVWWAGVELAPVWLDVARDYSEDWTHQQQIRDAVGIPGLTDAEYLDPVLDTFLRAAPHVYRNVSAAPGASVQIDLADHDRTVTWSLNAEPSGWFLSHGRVAAPTTRITLPAETLWRLASGGITTDTASRAAVIDGAHHLADPLLAVVSVVR
jgi:uncharacterized protein (TIGR03083 family)